MNAIYAKDNLYHSISINWILFSATYEWNHAWIELRIITIKVTHWILRYLFVGVILFFSAAIFLKYLHYLIAGVQRAALSNPESIWYLLMQLILDVTFWRIRSSGLLLQNSKRGKNSSMGHGAIKQSSQNSVTISKKTWSCF